MGYWGCDMGRALGMPPFKSVHVHIRVDLLLRFWLAVICSRHHNMSLVPFSRGRPAAPGGAGIQRGGHKWREAPAFSPI